MQYSIPIKEESLLLHSSKRLFLDYTSTANLKTISKSKIEYSLIKITD